MGRASESVLVNGLPLPGELLALIGAGRWRCPDDLAGIDWLFPDRGGLYLYSFATMRSETEGLKKQGGPMWLGAPDPAHPPGDIDLRQAVLIADLGLGYDQPIALDYRQSLTRPCVLTLRWSSRGDANRWVEIAPDVQTFADLIGL